MTGKLYYLTTLNDWRCHAERFAQSHFIVLDPPAPFTDSSTLLDPAAKILVVVEADEGAHLALEDDAAFEQLPHAFASKPISQAAHAAISSALANASHPASSSYTAPSLGPDATTFDAAEAAARIHPLLRPRVF